MFLEGSKMEYFCGQECQLKLNEKGDYVVPFKAKVENGMEEEEMVLWV